MRPAIALSLLLAACSGAGAIMSEDQAAPDKKPSVGSEPPTGERPITPSATDAGVVSSLPDAAVEAAAEAGVDAAADAPSDAAADADATAPPPPVPRYGVTFDGSPNQRAIANLPADLIGRSVYTLEGWFSHAVAETEKGSLFSTSQPYCAIVTTGVGVGKVACCPDGTGLSCRYSAAVMQTNKFFHLAVVVSDATMSMYVDGILEATVAAPGTYTSANQFSNNLIFGGLAEASAKVIVDEFRLSYTKRYDANFIPPAHLDADGTTKTAWLIDEGAGPTSGSLTLSGGASWVAVVR